MKGVEKLTAVRLAEILTERNSVSSEVITDALYASDTQGESFVDTIVGGGHITDWELAKLVTEHFNLPFMMAGNYSIPDDAKSRLPKELLFQHTMVPLDMETILNSVARTGRLVIVDPAHTTCSAAAEISAVVAEKVFDSLKAPIIRVTTPDTQIPFSPAIEKQLYPDAAKTIAAVKRVMEARARAA